MREANDKLRNCLIGGALLYAVGLIILIMTWPTGLSRTSDSGLMPIIAGLLVSLGGALVFVALVGFGVKLGNEASKSR